jgi:hypothetical protein
MAPEANAELLQVLAALDLDLALVAGSGLYTVSDHQTAEVLGRSLDPQAAAVIALRKLRRSYDALRALKAALRYE